MDHTRKQLKQAIIKRFRTLRLASVNLKINYYRVSHIVNGWIAPHSDEIKRIEKALGMSAKELGL